jgi:hypothetical protein
MAKLGARFYSRVTPMHGLTVKGSKQFACFLSHHKDSCAMEARFIKEHLEEMMGRAVFLDSDDLRGAFNHTPECPDLTPVTQISLDCWTTCVTASAS